MKTIYRPRKNQLCSDVIVMFNNALTPKQYDIFKRAVNAELDKIAEGYKTMGHCPDKQIIEKAMVTFERTCGFRGEIYQVGMEAYLDL